MWQACVDALPTRWNLCKRKVMTEELCVVCGGPVESTEHVFRDCHMARAVWFRGLGVRVDGGQGECFLNWVAKLQFNGLTPGFELGLMLIWALWNHRNEILWLGKALQPLDIVLRAEGWMQEFHKWHKSATKKKNRDTQRWGRPAEGWFKCNFDGAWNKFSNRGGFGVVIRNHLGECLAAVAGPIERVSSATHAKLFAARRAAMLVSSNGLAERKVPFEGDSTLVLAAMRGRSLYSWSYY